MKPDSAPGGFAVVTTFRPWIGTWRASSVKANSVAGPLTPVTPGVSILWSTSSRDTTLIRHLRRSHCDVTRQRRSWPMRATPPGTAWAIYQGHDWSGVEEPQGE